MKESPSQTAGPYVHIGCVPNWSGIAGVYPRDLGAAMIDDATEGERIALSGTIYDGEGAPLTDAMVEVWQADGAGRAGLFGRRATDFETGEWTVKTVKPGRVALADGRSMAPHITLWIVARGINIGLHTRLYFPDEANADDPMLALAGPRAGTLIAGKTGEGAYRFDIRLQGEAETVFFDV